MPKIVAAIVDLYSSGKLGREINLYQGGGGGGSDVRKEGDGRAPSPTVHSNFSSNMVGRVNDCALVTLTRAIKTPVLQVSHDVESMSFLFQQLPHLGDTFTTVSALWRIDLL